MGIKLQAKIKVKHNYKNIRKISDMLPEAVKTGVEKAVKETCKYALHLLGTDNGGITFEIVNVNTKEVKGRVYTDQNKMPWSWFREFGTRNMGRTTTYRNNKAFY